MSERMDAIDRSGAADMSLLRSDDLDRPGDLDELGAIHGDLDELSEIHGELGEIHGDLGEIHGDPGATSGRPRPAGEGTRTIRLPHAVASVPDSREVLVADLTSRHLSTTVIEEAEMVVSELVSNAIRHAKGLADGCVRIRWKVKGGAVEIEVSDGGGPTVPKPSPPSPWAVGGRGLRIVRSLAHEWGVQEDRHGRTVWAAVGGPSRRRRL